jgi:hypothetical protein
VLNCQHVNASGQSAVEGAVEGEAVDIATLDKEEQNYSI